FSRLRPPLASALFPYTTLFRSVVRLARRPHHVVLGDDRASVTALGTRLRLQFVRPLVDSAQVDGREIVGQLAILLGTINLSAVEDRKSTRLNSSHDQTSYAVFC